MAYIAKNLFALVPTVLVSVADDRMFPTPDMLPETAALPSKLCPHRPRAVASFVAVPALPLTAVCTGCTWSSLAHFVAVPTAAVAATFGAAVPA